MEKILLRISLTTHCNLSCRCCPMKQFRNKQTSKKILNLYNVANFINTYIPKTWYLEFTGGEPALFADIDTLLLGCKVAGFKGLVKTNGLLPIKQCTGFKRVAAFHNLQTPPKYYDVYLIIAGLPNFAEKVAYCNKQNIPYKVIGKNQAFMEEPKTKGWKQLFLTPDGNLKECDNKNSQIITNIFSMEENMKIKPVAPCVICKSVEDFYTFLEDKE